MEPTELVTAARAGDAKAFEELVRRHQCMVMATALGITADPSAAEDVAQQVFVDAWSSLDTLQDPRRISGWLRQMARHRSHNRVRGEQRSGRLRPEDAAPRETPEEALARAEEARVVREALEVVPADDRTLLTLFYWHGRSAPEVAQALGLSAAAVRKRLSRARQSLRAEVEASLADVVVARRPGASFTAVVMLLVMMPTTGEAAPSSRVRRRGVGVVAGMVMAWCLWAVTTPETVVGPVGSHPTRVWRMPSFEPVDAEPEPRDEMPLEDEVRLHVFALYQFEGATRSTLTGFSPSVVFADLDLEYPDLESIDLLEDILDREVGYSRRSAKRLEEPLSEQAYLDGLGLEQVELDDPGAVFAAIEIFRRESVNIQERLHFERLDRMRNTSVEEPEVDAGLGPMVDLIDEVMVRPEYAEFLPHLKVYKLHALALGGSDVHDPSRAFELATELLETEKVGRVRQQTLEVLAEGGFEVPVVSAEVRRAMLEGQDLDTEAALRRMFLRSSMEDGDLEQAERDLDAYEALARSRCPHWPIVGVWESDVPNNPEDSPMLNCEGFTEGVDLMRSRLASMGVGDGQGNWRRSFLTAAWRCVAGSTTRIEAKLKSTVHEDGWRWKSWNEPSPFTDCMDVAKDGLVLPPTGWRLDVEVFRF